MAMERPFFSTLWYLCLSSICPKSVFDHLPSVHSCWLTAELNTPLVTSLTFLRETVNISEVYVVSSPDFSACVRKNTSSYGEAAMTTLTNATLILMLLFPSLNRTCCTTRYTEDCCCTAFIWLQKGSSLNTSQLLLKSFERVIQTMWSSVIMQYRWHASVMCQCQIPQFCIPVYPKAKVLFSCCHTVHPESLPAKCKCLSDKFMEDLRCFHTAPAQLIPYLEEPRCKAQEGPQANIRTNS